MSSRATHEPYRVRDDLRFEYFEAIDGDHSPGYKTDQVVAFLENKEVGYLKISDMPRERFDRYYPGILNYLRQVKGHGVLPFNYKTTPWQQIPIDALRDRIYEMALCAGLGWHESCNTLSRDAKKASAEEVRQMVCRLEGLIEKERGKEFKRFESFVVDKPIVAFISVEEAFLRQGIGTALYRAGFQWLRSRGLTLYASDCQTEPAQRAWEAMSQRFVVQRVQEKLPTSGKVVTRLRFAA
jgi:GNAT superfamily N-acetyltransferase